jgi:hypothetical protein
LLDMDIFDNIRDCHNDCYYENQSCSQVHIIFLFGEPVVFIKAVA